MTIKRTNPSKNLSNSMIDKFDGFASSWNDIPPRKQMEVAIKASEGTTRALLNATTESAVLIDTKGTILAINEAGAQRFDKKPEDTIGLIIYDLLTPHFARQRKEYINEVIATGEPVRFEDQHDGRYLDNSLYPVFDNQGKVVKIAAYSQDITLRRQMEKALRESEDRFRSAFEYAAIGMALVELSGQLLEVNSALCSIVGYPEQELLSMTFQDITHPDDLDADLEYAQQLLDGKISSYQMEKRYIHKSGLSVWALFTGSLVRNADGQPLHIIAQIQDISERKQAEERLKYLSLHDPLTGLYNRAYFEQEMRRFAGSRQVTGIIICDVDGLKLINDTLGHKAGDALLKAAAGVLKKSFRSSDMVARIGGDEFAVLLPCSEETAVKNAALRIKESIAKYNSDGPDLPLSISIGFAASSKKRPDLNEVFKEADNMMYREKLNSRLITRKVLVQTLFRALESRDFKPEGQVERLQGYLRNLGISEGSCKNPPFRKGLK